MKSMISIDKLSKRYQIKPHGESGYKTFREELLSLPKRIFAPKARKEEFWALKDVSLDIKQGECVGIIGRNGAGKSTLLKVLSRITPPTKGRVTLKGRVASLLEVGTGFHPELTGLENIFMNGAILGMGRAEVARKLDEIIDFAGVERFLNTPVKRYSSGMYVRLAFAVAAHLEPEILIVDEVLAVGDAEFQNKCLGKMEEVSRSMGRTVLLVSHNMAAIRTLCSKAALLEHGGLTAFGAVDKVVAQYAGIHDQDIRVSITPDMHVKGGKDIEFQACTLRNLDGDAMKEFRIGEDICVEIEFDSKISKEISFWLIIFDSMGTPLLSTHQRDLEMAQVAHGSFRLTYRTRGLNLLPGQYSVAAGAFDKQLNFLEWADRCQCFEIAPTFISGSPFDGRWGKIDQPASWTLQKVLKL